MSLSQDYFGDSAEALKQQIKESRATLEDLPDQVPGGREEAFQALFQELMDNYSSMEECINEARDNVANLDTDQIRRQGEVEASDAARRQARELGVDLTEIEGTGSDGRIVIDDVKNAAEAAGDGAAQQAQGAVGQATDQAGQIASQAGGAAKEVDATDAARREAEERGIDLSQVEGTGTDGRIIISDVTEIGDQAEGGAGPAGQLKSQASDAAGQAAQGAQDTAGQAAGQAQQAVGQATDQAGQVAGQATDQAGQVAGQAQEAVGGLTGGGEEEEGGGGGPLGGVTDQVGQVAGQAQEVAGQATDQAGQATQGVQDTAGQAAGQAQEAAGQAGQSTGRDGAEGPKITNAAKRKAEEMGVDISKVKGTGSGGLITIKDVSGS
ncbi:MAG: E3 binding domain-containing protein [Rubrobacter sp.]|nr:E3 binding domain-containing protein [Rubrobacter sp.]